MKDRNYYESLEGAIAVIGMSGAFSKSKDINEYWQNILAGRECIDDLTAEELQAAGIPQELSDNPLYVRRTAGLESAKEFDPAFFGYTPAEARLMDPQHRLFLEHSWKCLEDGNIIPDHYDGLIGVFGGCSQNNYLLKNLIYSDQADKAGAFQIMIGNDKDYLTTKVSYKLNLKGPSITMQTACSTSLTAIQQGCLSLLNYQSDMALCGGASVNVPYRGGYLYQDGMIFSPDGHCRAFDKDANGTVFGDGVGVVLLKRFEDALEDGDLIHAIIRGSAINNDGSEKVGYTAPGVKAQAEVVATALAVADVSADTIGYVETHGTGTLMGDPIELAALTEAFRMSTEEKNYCHIGSAKPNIGHLDAAAGVASFIKAVMVLKTGTIPPLTNFTSPNPALNIEETPFTITSTPVKWDTEVIPRRAGVSALGVGGTNVHLVLEEYTPSKEPSPEPGDKPNLLVFSAKSEESLTRQKELFSTFLKKKDISLPSLAYTLQKKRVPFPYRDFLVTDGKGEYDESTFINKKSLPCNGSPEIAFIFTGQGSQYPNMGKSLYESVPFIKKIMDHGFSILERTHNLPLKEIIYPEGSASLKESEMKLMQTTYTQPALFLLEYALARYLIILGLQPAYLLGHSLGEYTAACLSGIFTFEDALSLVAERGRIMQTAPKGSMISIPLSRNAIESMITGDQLQVSVINAPDRCVVSGSDEAVDLFQKELTEKDIRHSRLKTSHAYHSFLMDSILDEFASSFSSVTFHKPEIPIITNQSTESFGSENMESAEYWVDQLRQPVDFDKGISLLLKNKNVTLVEVGPGNTLITLAKLNPDMKGDNLCLPTVRNPKQQTPDHTFFLTALGKLWQKGHSLHWDEFYGERKPEYIRIPTYEFDNRSYWIEGIKSKKSPLPIEETEENYIEKREELTVKEKVLHVWSEIFGNDDIGETDNFYDMGGHSVLATQLLSRINETFNLEIGMGALLMEPTPANSLALVEEQLPRKKPTEVQSPSSPKEKVLPMMFPVQKGDPEKKPLFMVAGMYFNRYDHESEEEGQRKYEEDYFRYFSTLVKNIGTSQPIYGFRPKGIFLNEKPHKNVKAMAESYITEMKKIQPEGPYLIGGECIGGIITYEMAMQLQGQGEEVKHLILIDTFYPRAKAMFRDAIRVTLWRFKDEFITPLKNKEKSFINRLLTVINHLQLFLFPIGKKQKNLKQVQYSNVAYMYRLMSYSLKLYDKKNITLLVNQEWSDDISPTLNWKKKHILNVNLITVPGTHVSCLTDYGHITGKHIRDIIDND